MSEENENSEPGNAKARNCAKPRIKLLRDDVPRCIKCNRAQQKHARRMRGGDDNSKQHSVPRRTARTHEIRRDNGFAMSRFQRMQRTQASGNQRRQGSITKHGNPRLRRALVEMAWRLMRFQPGYHAVKKWQLKMREAAATQRSRRKKIIVAIARQLAVDLWRLNTGQTTPEKLGLTLAPL